MDCRDTERLIDAWLDRELPGEQARQVEAHVAECPTCRRRFMPVVDFLGSTEPVSVPDGLRDRIVDAVSHTAGGRTSAEGRTMGTRRWRAAWVGAAAACVGFFVVGWFGSHWWVSPSETVTETPKVAERPEVTPEPQVTVVLSPWMLSSWAQAMALRGPVNPAPLFAQALVAEVASERSFEMTPVIRVRRRPIAPETADRDRDAWESDIPFLVTVGSSLRL
ncbi:MAG TPA: zf-HC2 domain-containing protein [Phycisphaerae bacterium]|nr:zf-HC2 domain-containing protein [Phycisphaerae bacterium]